MGAAIFAFLLLGLLAFGLTGIFLCLIVRLLRRSLPLPLRILSAVCALCILFPVGIAGFFAHSSSTPPEDFVDTGLTACWEDSRWTRFTAGGVAYVELPHRIDYVQSDPLFSAKTEPWYTASQWHNLFRAENDGGFDIVCNKHGRLYCAESELNAILQYYEIPR